MKVLPSKEKNNNKKYVLFHCHHLSTLFQFVLFRETVFKNIPVTLLVNHKSFTNSDFTRNLLKNSIFDRILMIQEPKNFKERQKEIFIQDYYDEYFTKNNLNFNDIIEVFTACDLNNLFPIYCVLNDISVSYIEMYTGQFMDKTRYEASTKMFGYPSWVEMLSKKYSSLSGDGGPYTKKRYLWKNSVCEYPEKDVRIDYLDAFYSMSSSTKLKVGRCVGLDLSNKSVDLFLLNGTKWTSAITKLATPYTYLPYFLYIDYILDDQENVVIKNHPHSDNDEFFCNTISSSSKANTISSTIPIEFLGLIENFHINRIFSIESSGNKKVSSFVNKNIILGVEFLEFYLYTNRLYVLKTIMKIIGLKTPIKVLGISTSYVNKFFYYSKDLKMEYGKKTNKIASEIECVIVCGGIPTDYSEIIRTINRECLMCYLEFESFQQYLIRNPEIQQFIKVRLKINATDNSCLYRTKFEENLFIVCEDNNCFEILNGLHYSYKLKYSCLEIFVDAMLVQI